MAKPVIARLDQLRQRLGRRDLIRVHSTAALSAGFAFGRTFTARGLYHLEVIQQSGDKAEHWRSDADRPGGVRTPEFRRRELAGDPRLAEALVVIYATKTQPLDKVLKDVAARWGDADVLQRLGEDEEDEYDGAAIFQLLREGFSNDELRSLAFSVPALRSVYDNLSAGMTTSEIARQIVERAEKHLQFKPLLRAVEEQNPRRYRQSADRLKHQLRSTVFQRVLLLESEIASRDRRFLVDWEAAELARSSQSDCHALRVTCRRRCD